MNFELPRPPVGPFHRRPHNLPETLFNFLQLLPEFSLIPHEEGVFVHVNRPPAKTQNETKTQWKAWTT